MASSKARPHWSQGTTTGQRTAELQVIAEDLMGYGHQAEPPPETEAKTPSWRLFVAS